MRRLILIARQRPALLARANPVARRSLLWVIANAATKGQTYLLQYLLVRRPDIFTLESLALAPSDGPNAGKTVLWLIANATHNYPETLARKFNRFMETRLVNIVTHDLLAARAFDSDLNATETSVLYQMSLIAYYGDLPAFEKLFEIPELMTADLLGAIPVDRKLSETSVLSVIASVQGQETSYALDNLVKHTPHIFTNEVLSAMVPEDSLNPSGYEPLVFLMALGQKCYGYTYFSRLVNHDLNAFTTDLLATKSEIYDGDDSRQTTLWYMADSALFNDDFSYTLDSLIRQRPDIFTPDLLNTIAHTEDLPNDISVLELIALGVAKHRLLPNKFSDETYEWMNQLINVVDERLCPTHELCRFTLSNTLPHLHLSDDGIVVSGRVESVNLTDNLSNLSLYSRDSCTSPRLSYQAGSSEPDNHQGAVPRT